MSSFSSINKIRNAEIGEDGSIARDLLILDEHVIFPHVLTTIIINDETARAAVTNALKTGQTLIAVARRAPDQTPSLESLYPIGVEVAIAPPPNGQHPITAVVAQGRRRVHITQIDEDGEGWRAHAQPLDDQPIAPERAAPLMTTAGHLFRQRAELSATVPKEVADFILALEDPAQFCDAIAATFSLPLPDRQHILELLDVEERLQQIAFLLSKELSLLEVRDEINSHIEQELARNQREMYLREQMRVIQTELGEQDIFQQELNELRDKIASAPLSDAAREQAIKEFSRLSIIPAMAPEVGVIRTYLDWLLSIPWQTQSEDNLALDHAEATLDADHYGLPKIKDRILEYIAVRKLAPDKMKSPILCFVGPPGVGKTSLGKSIAKALGREFIRVSLGGLRDEAEIRGHRRTYIGALPGRIIQTMRGVGAINPVMMLDEIDKMSADYRGDPAAALLEVLDPEQNNAFVDHYLEVPYDLSKVLFITTANDLSPLSPALEDRLEVIEFSGYTEEEKVQIARRFLLPKQLEAHGLDAYGIRFETDALLAIIREYTYESGVRNLEREIASVCRKLARLVAQGKAYPKRITARQVQRALGPAYYTSARANQTPSVGVVTGLVWTPAGGDIQTTEVSVLPGKGSLLLTGQLGEVLQESAQAALSYARSRATDFHIPHDDFENYDVHIHLPEGAVPKDGPSAGITLATAILSAFTECPVRSDYAMTGEITLRGKVLAVGGIKEKVLAARRNRIPHIILPSDNRKDIVDVPKEALKHLQVTFVDDMQAVLDLVLLPPPPQRKRDLENPKRADTEDEAPPKATVKAKKKKKRAKDGRAKP